jgi:hypothetical protein
MPPGGWASETQTAELSASDHSNPTGGDEYFGWSVGVSGPTIVVGAYHQKGTGGYAAPGEAYVFVMPPGGWVNAIQTAELTASDPNADEDLGWSVGVSGDTVVVGAPNREVGANLGQGTAYVFVMPTTGWVNATPTANLTASDAQAGDELGYSVAISGNTIVAGARARQIGEHDGQGVAYVWTEPSSGWVTTSADTAELTASDGSTADNLGESVAVSGTTVVAGAPRHYASSETADYGAAYVFGPGSESNGGSTGGGGTSTSGGGSSPPPPLPPPTARVVSISGGHEKISVVLSCPSGAAACVPVSLKAMIKEHLDGKRIIAITASGKEARIKTKQMLVSAGSATLSAGSTETLTLKLNATGRALLSKFGKLEVVVTATSGGKTIGMAIVKVQKPAPKKRK